jgi:hypothetical protein
MHHQLRQTFCPDQLDIIKISGRVSPQERADVLLKFDLSSRPGVLFLASDSCSSVLDLSSIGEHIFLKLSWNLATDLHALCQAQSLGKVPNILITQLILHESIDVHIQAASASSLKSATDFNAELQHA